MQTKQTILFLIGNRDLQIKKDHSLNANPIINAFFTRQNDGHDFTIKKMEDERFSFIEASEQVLANYETLKSAVTFPMIEDTLHNLRLEKPQLVFCGTCQQPKPYHQDTRDFVLFAAKFFTEKGYDCKTELMPVNPNEFGLVTEYYADIFANITQTGNQLYISNSGGTPTMRAASHFAGIFKGYKYVHIISSKKDGVMTKTYHFETFQKQEQIILTEIIHSKLQMYDYEGILLLPSISDEIRKLCYEALDIYNLKKGIDLNGNYEGKAIDALNVIVSNMLVCFHKGGYTDTIQRIFRIEEQIGQLLLFRWLKSEGFTDSNNNIVFKREPKPFESFIKGRAKIDLLKNHYPHLISGFGKEAHFRNFPTAPLEAIAAGKNFFFFLFRSLNLHQEMYDFWAVSNGNYSRELNPLGNLRNNSMLGHGFRGVGEQDLADALGKPFEIFQQDLKHLMERYLGIFIFNIFDNINQDIKKLM